MFTNIKKDSLIQLRVNKQQKDTIKKLAADNNMNVTEYIFSLLENKYKEEDPKE